jgi:hypothetical protein
MALRIDDIPFNLRAGDVVKHILSIDSRFRENTALTSSNDFFFRLLSPIRNVLRIRITSIEFPNAYYIFSAARKNNAFQIIWGTSFVTFVIPDGNYSAGDLVNTLRKFIAENVAVSWLTIDFNPINGKFTFAGSQPFTLDTTCSNVPPPVTGYILPLTYDRPFDYGLGYNMGFSRGKFDSSLPDASGTHFVISDNFSDFSGDSYLFLKINNFDCVRQTVVETDFNAMAKIILRDPKTYMTFDDYASQHAKEVTFPNPQDLSRFHIQLLDPYGVPVDMGSSEFSFSLEVIEVRNLGLYNTIRDAFAATWKI